LDIRARTKLLYGTVTFDCIATSKPETVKIHHCYVEFKKLRAFSKVLKIRGGIREEERKGGN
jgi:hypothetical protein